MRSIIAGNFVFGNCNKKLLRKYNTQFNRAGPHKDMKHSAAISLYYIEL